MMFRLFLVVLLLIGAAARADSSSPAAYYDRQRAIIGGIAYAWEDGDTPRQNQSEARQAGVGRSAYYVRGTGGMLKRYRRISARSAILPGGCLMAWGAGYRPEPAEIMTAVAAGSTATIALKTGGSLWQWDRGENPRRLELPGTRKGTP